MAFSSSESGSKAEVISNPFRNASRIEIGTMTETTPEANLLRLFHTAGRLGDMLADSANRDFFYFKQ